jgi:hypothetical protein
MKLLLVSILFWMSLAGCSSGGPTSEELEKADYGTPIQQPEAQSLAAAWVAATLEQGPSAEYDWGTVRPGWMEGDKLIFGYRLDARIDLRVNSGGHTGFKRYVFMFKDGALEGVWGEESLGGTSFSTHMKRLK